MGIWTVQEIGRSRRSGGDLQRLALLRGLFWPAFMVYEVFDALAA